MTSQSRTLENENLVGGGFETRPYQIRGPKAQVI